ncbi:hypothetical protein SDC9_113555 [bioreactor metagenome]|uniref:Uncharacterized protein n=1 Tax=bioreactor metagenome TaxID=1076179 RepID=A0A645BN18_9ZZZZ
MIVEIEAHQHSDPKAHRVGFVGFQPDFDFLVELGQMLFEEFRRSQVAGRPVVYKR